MTVVAERVFPRLYRDSVELMAIASAVEGRDQVDRVGAVMATPGNLQILAASGMLPDGLAAAPDDLLIVVRASDADAALEALDDAESRLTSADKASGPRAEIAPQTIDEGVAAAGEQPPTLVAISVSGEFAPVVGEQALQHDLHVFCFSDNVSVADEVRLKKLAVSKGRLFMGPDCGTAIIDSVPLGFANRVRSGPIGIVAASGTGAQEVSCLLHQAGTGVSQVIGVGGRDLKAQVGAIMTMFALDLLEADTATEVAVIVSKPPAAEVADALLARLDGVAGSGTKVVACMLGLPDTERPSGVVVRGTLEGGAIAAAAAAGVSLEPANVDPATVGASSTASSVLGLYTGGTLASEASLILAGAGVPATILDLGDDEYTAGKPHPMIDPGGRAARIVEAGADPNVTVLLVDVVLGYGAHADPAASVIEAVTAAKTQAAQAGRELIVIGSVTGTDQDPQGLARQRERLIAAGIVLVDSNAGAARLAATLAGGQA